MAVTLFRPTDLNNVHTLIEKFFSGKEELAKLEDLPESVFKRASGSLYYSRFRVAWVLTTLPFRAIYVIFLHSMSGFLHRASLTKMSTRVSFQAKLFETQAEQVLRQLYWGGHMLVPSFNTYSPKASYLIDYEPIGRQAIESPFIQNHLTNLFDKINFDWSDGGLCHGAVYWFNYLFLLGMESKFPERCDTYTEYMRGIGEMFKEGQPIQSALLQALYGVDAPLLKIKETHFQIARENYLSQEKLVKGLSALPEGLYHIQVTGVHSLSFFNSKEEKILFDPNIGIVRIDTFDELANMLNDHIEKMEDVPLILSYHTLEKPSRLKRLWSRVFGSSFQNS